MGGGVSKPGELSRLLAIMSRLRDPEAGCPWDRQQDFRSISAYTVEEAYEVADAIERGDLADLKDELGDLLFHVVFHAQMAAEQGAFDFAGVVAGINDKLVRRHPHVFADTVVEDEQALYAQWERQKRQERKKRGDNTGSVLDGIASSLPALRWAEKIQKRVADNGFDWADIESVRAKLDEELAELQREVEASGGDDRVEDELGDVLFSVVNLARHLAVDPEQALRRANRKFQRRFRQLEILVRDDGKTLPSCSEAELEAYWRRVKCREVE